MTILLLYELYLNVTQDVFTDYVGFLRVYYTGIFHNGNFLALNFMPLFDFYIVIWGRRGWELTLWPMVTENMK